MPIPWATWQNERYRSCLSSILLSFWISWSVYHWSPHNCLTSLLTRTLFNTRWPKRGKLKSIYEILLPKSRFTKQLVWVISSPRQYQAGWWYVDKLFHEMSMNGTKSGVTSQVLYIYTTKWNQMDGYVDLFNSCSTSGSRRSTQSKYWD